MRVVEINDEVVDLLFGNREGEFGEEEGGTVEGSISGAEGV